MFPFKPPPKTIVGAEKANVKGLRLALRFTANTQTKVIFGFCAAESALAIRAFHFFSIGHLRPPNDLDTN